MTVIQTNTPLRDRERRAEMTYIKSLWTWARHLWATRHHPHIKDISAHHARDIGLSEAGIAYHKHKHPSQTTHHPRM